MSLVESVVEAATFVTGLMKDCGFNGLESAVPGINLLISLGNWFEKRGVPPQVIKELCKKHNIEPSRVSSLEDLKSRIKESEIELFLSRALARVDFPSLVRYLDASLGERDEKIDNLLHLFQDLENVLKGPYTQLYPAERVLETLPHDTRFINPQFFRKTGPVAADIDGGKVYIRPEVNGVIEALENKPAVLLHGVAGSGKSVVARTVAYRWLKKRGGVRFVQCKTEEVNYKELVTEAARFGKENPDSLLVVEDTHLKAETINQFLSRTAKAWPRLLVTSRKTGPELESYTVNHFRDLENIPLNPSDPADDIISLFFRKKGWELTDRLKKEIISASKKSLWLLSYALKSLEKTEGKEIHHGAVLEYVEVDLRDLEKKKNAFNPKLLIALSLLYRYEILTDARFLKEKFRDAGHTLEDELNDLARMGEVVQSTKNRITLYGLPHSELAKLYFHFSKNSDWEEPTYEDENQFICDYAVSKKAMNWWELFTFWRSPFSPERTKRLNKRKLAERIDETEDIGPTTVCIATVSGEDRYSGMELVNLISLEKLARRIAKSETEFPPGWCIGSVSFANPTAGKKLVSLINSEKLAEKIIVGMISNPELWGFVAVSYINAFSVTDTNAEEEFVRQLAKRVVGTQDAFFAIKSIDSIHKLKSDVGNKFLQVFRQLGPDPKLAVLLDCLEQVWSDSE